MLNNVNMRGRDAVAAKLAECFITIDGRRYNFMQMINFEASLEKVKTEIPVLGKTGKAHKGSGWSGKFTATAHYNQSIMRQMLIKYKDTGEDTYFEIQVTNDDPTSSAGRQTMVFIDCNLDGGILAKFDAAGEYLDEAINGTFDDFKMPESFTNLTGME